MSESIASIVCEKGLGSMPERVCGGRWKIANGKAQATTEARTAELKASECRGCEHGDARASGKPRPLLQVLTPDQVKQRLLKRQARNEARKAADAPAPDAPDVAPTPALDVAAEQAAPEMEQPKKTCALDGCGATFRPIRNQRFCSPDHAASALRTRRNEERAVDAGRQPLVEQRRDCAECGDSFAPRTGNERYCSGCKGAVPVDSRVRARTAPAPEDEQSDPIEAENTEEETMREATCDRDKGGCGKAFKVKTATGKLPSKCPQCKEAASEAPATRPRAPRTVRPQPPRGGASQRSSNSLDGVIAAAASRVALREQVQALVDEVDQTVAVEALAEVLAGLMAGGG